MEGRDGLAQRIWVMDRGMTSEDNPTWLQETGRRYLVGTPKTELRGWARDRRRHRLAPRAGWGGGKAVCRVQRGGDPSSWCALSSAGKRSARCTRFCRRIEEGLAKLGQRLG
jgi:hypothetical protein